jgi:hypothetical protein
MEVDVGAAAAAAGAVAGVVGRVSVAANGHGLVVHIGSGAFAFELALEQY